MKSPRDDLPGSIWYDRRRRTRGGRPLDLLPILPQDEVLFPGESRTVRVVDERRRSLVEECLVADAPFGVLLAVGDGKGLAGRVGGAPALARVGTSARITDARRHLEEGLVVTVVGVRRFELVELLPRRPGRLWARVRYPDEEEPAREAAERLRSLFAVYRERVALLGRGTPGPDLPPYDTLVPYAVAARLSLSPYERQRLLEGRMAERLTVVLQYLRRELTLLRLMEEDLGPP